MRPLADIPRVVAVVGSPRRGGNTAALVDAALEEFEGRGCRCKRVQLSDRRIAPCLGHEGCSGYAACPQGDEAAAVLDDVYTADVLVLATPVYYENVSAQMKAFIDRNVFRYSHEEWLPAKAIGLIAVTAETGLDETLAALRRYVDLSTQGDVTVLTLGGYADELGAAAAQPELLAAARRLAADLLAAAGGPSGPPDPRPA